MAPSKDRVKNKNRNKKRGPSFRKVTLYFLGRTYRGAGSHVNKRQDEKERKRRNADHRRETQWQLEWNSRRRGRPMWTPRARLKPLLSNSSRGKEVNSFCAVKSFFSYKRLSHGGKLGIIPYRIFYVLSLSLLVCKWLILHFFRQFHKRFKRFL